MKSWLRSAALAVVSAVTLTGAPAIANAAPTTAPVTQQVTQAQLENAARTFDGLTVAKDGSALTLKNGTFAITRGNNLQILDAAGNAVTSLPLKALLGDSFYTLNAALSNGGKTVTLHKGTFVAKATAEQLARKSRFVSNTKAWFNLYGDYASYALGNDTLNFVGGTILGILAGAVGGWLINAAISFVIGVPLYILNYILGLTIIGVPAGLAITFVVVAFKFGVWGTAVTIAGLNIPALLSRNSDDPIARKKAERLLRGTKAYFTGKDVTRV